MKLWLISAPSSLSRNITVGFQPRIQLEFPVSAASAVLQQPLVATATRGAGLGTSWTPLRAAQGREPAGHSFPGRPGRCCSEIERILESQKLQLFFVQALTGSAATHAHRGGKSAFHNLPVTGFANLITKLPVGWHK